MKKPQDDFRHESLEDPESLARYLGAIMQGFSQRSLSISNRNGTIALEPHGLVHLEVRARRSRDAIRLSLDLSWKPGAEEEPSVGALTISSAGA